MIYLLGEIATLLAASLIIGLIVGWLFWGWRPRSVSRSRYEEVILERNQLLKKVEEQNKIEVNTARRQVQEPTQAVQIVETFEETEDSEEQEEVDLTALKHDKGYTLHDIDTDESKVAEEQIVSPRADGSDDLTVIKGIDSEIEEALHEQGINSYRQLGSLTKEQIEEIQNELDSDIDLNQSQDWVHQAQQLFNQKTYS